MEKHSRFRLRDLWDGRLAVVALSVAGVLFAPPPPLENNRLPVDEPQQFLMREINGRSWQDPLAAIERHRQETKQRSGVEFRGDSKRLADLEPDLQKAGATAAQTEPDASKGSAVADVDTPKGCIDPDAPEKKSPEKGPGQDTQVKETPPCPEVLAVLLPEGPYSEDSETRRRTRYAVVAGLNARHLVSATPDKLDVVFLRLDAQDPEDTPIVFERYLPPFAERQAKPTPKRTVVVMWLRAADFGARVPIDRLTKLKKRYPRSAPTWRIIGPTHSDALKAMINEVAGQTQKTDPPQEKVLFRMYSPYATAPDKILLDDIDPLKQPATVDGLLRRRGVSLVRTIGDDRLLADALIDELELRGVVPLPIRPKDAPIITEDLCLPSKTRSDADMRHIAIVAERDTVYGRSVLREFSDGGRSRRYCVDSYDYLRGLDGELPWGGGDQKPGANTAQSDPKAESRDTAHRPSAAERPAGQQQFDYLRRLAGELRNRDLQLRMDSADGQGLRAIGVLGTDVTDKLLVLQALRPEFPNAVFFTTDLDARFLHPREQPWARNLVIASSYGLTLSPEFQGGASPFRSNYQTAVYVSTLLAVEEGRLVSGDGKSKPEDSKRVGQSHVDKWFEISRTFEIGRTMAFGFRTGIASAFKGECSYKLMECDHLHPPGAAYYPSSSKFSVYMSSFLLLLGLWLAPALIFEDSRRWLEQKRKCLQRPNWGKELRQQPLLAAAIVAVVALQLGLPLLLAGSWASIAIWLNLDGSPLSAFEGISAWPAEAIRLVALLIGTFLLAWSGERLVKNGKTISKEFGLPSSNDKQPVVLGAWNEHLKQSTSLEALLKCVSLAVILLILGLLVVHAFGNGNTPVIRGELARGIHAALKWLLSILMCVTVVWVVINVYSCLRLVQELLSKQEKDWPELGLKPVDARLRKLDGLRANASKLKLIAARTSVVSKLVYLPFVVPSILLMSTISFFGAPGLGLGPVLLTVTGVLVSVFCAWQLNHAAEAARRTALEEVDEKLLALPGASDEPARDALKLHRTWITDLSDGAFAPFWEQTMFNALLLPFAAFGSSSFIEAWLPRLLNGH